MHGPAIVVIPPAPRERQQDHEEGRTRHARREGQQTRQHGAPEFLFLSGHAFTSLHIATRQTMTLRTDKPPQEANRAIYRHTTVPAAAGRSEKPTRHLTLNIVRQDFLSCSTRYARWPEMTGNWPRHHLWPARPPSSVGRHGATPPAGPAAQACDMPARHLLPPDG